MLGSIPYVGVVFSYLGKATCYVLTASPETARAIVTAVLGGC